MPQTDAILAPEKPNAPVTLTNERYLRRQLLSSNQKYVATQQPRHLRIEVPELAFEFHESLAAKCLSLAATGV
jgi:hypothetical protein